MPRSAARCSPSIPTPRALGTIPRPWNARQYSRQQGPLHAGVNNQVVPHQSVITPGEPRRSRAGRVRRGHRLRGRLNWRPHRAKFMRDKTKASGPDTRFYSRRPTASCWRPRAARYATTSSPTRAAPAQRSAKRYAGQQLPAQPDQRRPAAIRMIRIVSKLKHDKYLDAWP